MVATQETAEHFWMKYCYDKDEEWLREHAYPFIKGAAEFYRNYYGFVKEEDGKYHFYRTNLHEHIGGGKDIIDDLSLARGTFAAAIAASEILGVDEDLRAEWQERLDNLADYPMVTDEGAIAYASADAFDGNVWAQGLEPSYYLRGLEGTESPKFKMLEKYDVLNMETRDQNMDDGQWETAINTYLSSPGYQNQYLNQLEDKNGSSRFLIDAAKLGRADDLTIMFPHAVSGVLRLPELAAQRGRLLFRRGSRNVCRGDSGGFKPKPCTHYRRRAGHKGVPRMARGVGCKIQACRAERIYSFVLHDARRG